MDSLLLVPTVVTQRTQKSKLTLQILYCNHYTNDFSCNVSKFIHISAFHSIKPSSFFVPCCCLQVSSGYLVVVFVYVTEFTGSKVRTWTSMHIHAAFAVGIMVVALIGYLVRVWWIYQIILSICTSPFLLFCWKFPETPFYLMAKGRYQETQVLLDTIARFNGLECRLKVEDLLEPMQLENGKALLEKEKDERPTQPEKKLSILDLFCSWRMAGRTCTVWAIWFIGSLGYYVFSLGSVNLGGNQYVNLFLAGECPIQNN